AETSVAPKPYGLAADTTAPSASTSRCDAPKTSTGPLPGSVSSAARARPVPPAPVSRFFTPTVATAAAADGGAAALPGEAVDNTATTAADASALCPACASATA